MTLNMFNQQAITIIGRALLIDKLVMNPGLSYVRITPPVVAGDHSTLGDELILQISFNIFCFLNES